MTHDDRSSNKVTLEDLLRLKRAERPSQEFWVQFERDLRAKQLAAIVEKRPWWHWAPPAMAKLSRLQVPLGATAALAVTLLTVHEYRSSNQQGVLAETVAPAVVSVSSQPMVAAPSAEASASNEATPVAVEVTESNLASVATVPAVAPTQAQVSAALGMVNNDTFAGYPRMMPTPSARTIEANLAAAKASDGDIAQMVDGLSSFESRVMPANARMEPLSQMQSPSEQRRSRILASALPAVSYGTDHASDSRAAAKVARTTLDDDRLYDSISRMAVGGDRLTLKF